MGELVERRGGRSPVVTEHEDIVTRVGIVHLLVRVLRDSAGGVKIDQEGVLRQNGFQDLFVGHIREVRGGPRGVVITLVGVFRRNGEVGAVERRIVEGDRECIVRHDFRGGERFGYRGKGNAPLLVETHRECDVLRIGVQGVAVINFHTPDNDLAYHIRDRFIGVLP